MILAEVGVVCSMSRRGNPFDNAVMEVWNSTFKVECGERFPNNEVARNEAFEFIEVFYNRKRLRLSRHAELRSPTARQPRCRAAPLTP